MVIITPQYVVVLLAVLTIIAGLVLVVRARSSRDAEIYLCATIALVILLAVLGSIVINLERTSAALRASVDARVARAAEVAPLLRAVREAAERSQLPGRGAAARVGASPRRATLDDVRRAWGIEGRLDCRVVEP